MDKQKKNPAKFNIQFDIKNPDHRKVIDILTPKGRNTAEYIAEAILYFEKNHSTDLRQTITEIVSEVLGISADLNLNPPENKSKEDEIDFSEISDALSGFKR